MPKTMVIDHPENLEEFQWYDVTLRAADWPTLRLMFVDLLPGHKFIGCKFTNVHNEDTCVRWKDIRVELKV